MDESLIRIGYSPCWADNQKDWAQKISPRKIVEQLVEAELVKTYADLYRITTAQIAALDNPLIHDRDSSNHGQSQPRSWRRLMSMA